MSQKELVKELGKPNQNISNYERVLKQPDFKMLKDCLICWCYNRLLTRHSLHDVDSMADEEIDEEIKELIVWNKDNQDDKREKLKMLRKIIKTFIEDY